MKKLVVLISVALLVCSLSFGASKTKALKAKLDPNQVVCPVMGTTLDKAKAVGSMEYKGKTYYFCCKACEKAFKKNPAKYADKKAELKCSCSCCQDGSCKGDCCKQGKCTIDCCQAKACKAKCCAESCKMKKCSKASCK